MKQFLKTALALSISISLFSCKKNNDETPDANTGKKYTLAFKSSTVEESEFIVETDDLMSGTINAENGIEQIGWRYVHSAGKTFFSSGYVDENVCVSYVKNDAGELTIQNEFVFDNSLSLFGTTPDQSTVLAMEAIYPGDSKNKLYTIDASTGSITGITSLSNYFEKSTGTVGYPTSLTVSNNKLFIPFIKYDSLGYFLNPVTDSAFVAVYSYPGLKFEKFISDARTGYIGVHGSTTGLVQTEDGTIYSSSSTSTVAGLSEASKPSGILKINAGSTSFDESYFFNVEEATNGGKIFRMHYLGNGKAFARIITNEAQGSWATWTAYSRDPQAFVQKGVIIDLEAQTVTDITDLPLHAKRYTAPVYQEDGKLYLSVETASDAYIYQVDINSATAVKGAKIEGKTIKGIFAI